MADRRCVGISQRLSAAITVGDASDIGYAWQDREDIKSMTISHRLMFTHSSVQRCTK